MIKLKPYRQYSEHDVINGLFSYDAVAGVPVSAGTIVKITNNYKDGSGNISNFSDLSFIDNTVSSLFSTVGKVSKVENWDDAIRPIGILLKTVAEFDENGTPLIYEPRMAAERDLVLPHQAVPILTRGVVLINEIDTNDHTGPGLGGLPDPGDAVYVGDNGSFATDGYVVIGHFLSSVDAEGYALVKFNF
jgi:hypothetical protein